jgi:iron complex outermembrane receptor protein
MNGQNQFFAETTHDVGLCSKFSGKVLAKSARLTVALYDRITRNVQRDVYFNIAGAPASFTHNIPQAEVEGIELDGEIHPAQWLTVGGNGAYTFATYTEPRVSLLGQNINFSTFQDTPRWAGSLYGQVDFEVPEAWGDMSIRADIYYQTNVYISSLYKSLDPGTKMPNYYALLNIRYDWQEIMGSRASISVYATNLLNRKYFLGGYALGADVGINTFIPGAPQMFGIETKYMF